MNDWARLDFEFLRRPALCGKDTLAANSVDLFLGRLGEELRLHDTRDLRADALTQELGVTRHAEVNHRDLAVLALHSTGLLRHERPQLVHINPVVVLTTSVSATARILAVLADTTVTGAHMTALLAVLLQVRSHGTARVRAPCTLRSH